MDKSLIKHFWNCGDSQIIEFAMMRARLNRQERNVLHLALDELLTQEQIAEELDTSTRNVQKIWASATVKMLNIEWVYAYSFMLKNEKREP